MTVVLAWLKSILLVQVIQQFSGKVICCELDALPILYSMQQFEERLVQRCCIVQIITFKFLDASAADGKQLVSIVPVADCIKVTKLFLSADTTRLTLLVFIAILDFLFLHSILPG